MIKNAPTGGRQRQRGAETVEFMLTFLLFLLVFFLIIDIAILMYNRGTVINASREGARQASLFWVDPALFDPTTPESNQLLKRSMVESIMTWTETSLLIDPATVGLTMTLWVNVEWPQDDDNLGEIIELPTHQVSSTDVVSVETSHPHSYLVTTALTGVVGPILTSLEALGVE